jgi:CRISPR-associated protein Cas1
VRALLDGHAPFEARDHRGAPDAVNSALNYGYGILYTQVWGAIVNAGLEPRAEPVNENETAGSRV